MQQRSGGGGSGKGGSLIKGSSSPEKFSLQGFLSEVSRPSSTELFSATLELKGASLGRESMCVCGFGNPKGRDSLVACFINNARGVGV